MNNIKCFGEMLKKQQQTALLDWIILTYLLTSDMLMCPCVQNQLFGISCGFFHWNVGIYLMSILPLLNQCYL